MTPDIVALDNQYILQTYGRSSFVIERGDGCYLYDTTGQQYLDCVAGIAVNALGYGDPDVTAAISQHAGGLLHLSNLYHNMSGAVLAKTLVERIGASHLLAGFVSLGADLRRVRAAIRE